MWKLTIEDDEGNVTPLPLAHDEYGIGRADSNQIRLTDRNVSRNHAVLKKNGAGWILRDAQSYNGTYVNGGRVIGEQPVNPGDVIQLGDYRLEVVDEGVVAAVVPGAPVAPPVPSVHQRPNRLVVVVGPTPGAEFPLDKEYFSIGRSEEATISVNHSSVSRLHAELFPLGGGRYEIVDKESANGIRINGVELKRGILEAGDALELGDVRLRFVGQGKIFRADMTQQMVAVGNFASDASKAQARGGMKLVFIGAAAVLAVVVGLIVVVTHGSSSANDGANAKHVVNKENAKQVEEALKLLDGKDYDGAHKKLLEIPDDKRPTDDAGFQKVESAWADYKFQQVDGAPDNAKKKSILKEISTTDTVDGKQRIKATEALRAIDAQERAAAEASAKAAEKAAPLVGGPNPGGGSGEIAPAPTGKSAVVPNLPAQGPPDEAAMRRGLEPKMRSGRASIDELKMLKAICSHMGDSACRDAAKAAIAAKSN